MGWFGGFVLGAKGPCPGIEFMSMGGQQPTSQLLSGTTID